MNRPLLLDLFCGAGGAAMGYHRAGFDVIGVDRDPQPRYPFEFVRADALDFVAAQGHRFDAIHASPPCQAYSAITTPSARSGHRRLIGPTRTALRRMGLPYVIENVGGAWRELKSPVTPCGSSFGLLVRRHRCFEANFPLTGPPCVHRAQVWPLGVYGAHPEDNWAYRHPDGRRRGRKARTVAEAATAMGIDWMSWRELCQAIPPAYTHYVGAQLVNAAGVVRAA